MRRSVAVLLAAATLFAGCSSTRRTSTATTTTQLPVVTSGPGASASTTSANGTSTAANGTSIAATVAPTTSVTTAAATTPAAGTPGTTTTVTVTTAGSAAEDRPYDVFVPKSYDGSNAVPLVLLLHGYGATGAIQEAYFKLQPLAEQRGFLYVHPDGTKDVRGSQFWNATDACCDLASANVDDSAYLTALIERVRATYKVDPKRIYLVGHSNGGFMSYRMACDHAGIIAAIVSLAGETFADTTACRPSEPVSVLQVQGTADQTIDFQGGGIIGHTYPGAQATVAAWAAYNGCGSTPLISPTKLDLEARIKGNETSVSTFAGCRPGGVVELWTIAGGAHIPALSSTFSADVVDFLYAHPKP